MICDSIANLLSATIPSDKFASLLGYYEAKDGGGGDFYWDPSDITTPQDNGTIFISATDSNGRWKRLYSGTVCVRWFGAKGNGINDDTPAIQAAIDLISSLGGGDVLAYSGTFMISAPINMKAKVNLKGNSDVLLKATANGFTSDRTTMIYMWDCDHASISGMTLDANAIDRNGSKQVIEHHIFLSNAVYNNLYSLKLQNLGSADKDSFPTCGYIFLVSKDTEDMFSSGTIGPCSNNTFTNIELEQTTDATSNFGIRVHSNWLDKIDPATFINHTEYNIFDHITVKGDFLWNMIEFAGGATVHNIVRNSFFTGNSITAIDFDKSSSYNIADGNTIKDLNLSPFTNAAVPPTSTYIFFPINDHSSYSNKLNYGNKIVNNYILNCGEVVPGSTADVRQAAIGVQHTKGSIVMNNTIDKMLAQTNGITILDDATDTIVTGNTIVTPRQGIGTNPSGKGIFNLCISNNTITSGSISIALVGNGNNVSNKVSITNNIVNAVASNGIITTRSYDNVVISGNLITAVTEKINVSSTNYIVSHNTLNGESNYAIRAQDVGAIINNTSLVPTSGVVLVGTPVVREFNNSWNSTPIDVHSIATATVKGPIKQMTAQENSTATDVAALTTNFNALLAKLRTSGALAPNP